MEFEMRAVKSEEWDALETIGGIDEDFMNSIPVSSLCWDSYSPTQCHTRYLIDASGLITLGENDVRVPTFGFRPAFVPKAPDNNPDGTIVKAGTLFMDGEPVQVPSRPVRPRNMTAYKPGATLELGSPIKSAKYVIKAIKVGSVYIADRPILNYISWHDLERLGLTEPARRLRAMMSDVETLRAAMDFPADLHWEKEFSWVSNEPGLRQGFLGKDFLATGDPSVRSEKVGFRPMFSGAENVSNGWTESFVTLYMDGEPVKLPQNPVHDGDIAEYIPGAKLDFRPSELGPDYQIHTIAIGDKFVADRCVLRNISWDDLKAQGFCN